ncbi:PREDICTED: cytochrome P450 71B34 [Theobroma cacao]|uniref:Cytochrome P450 71B34 n=1 Tax=Theobroma cacao TaxID=3641 RepID=A0AB32WES2_THECC|nr:PREDICTED: cytochrome P450 71B34 [Theobroma cacao]
MRKLRNLELFNAKSVQSFQFIREEEVAQMIESISQSSAYETPINLAQKMMALTIHIIREVALCKSALDKHKLQELVHEAFSIMGSFFAFDFFPYVGYIIDKATGLHGRLEKTFRDLDLLYQKVIDDHLHIERHVKLGS